MRGIDPLDVLEFFLCGLEMFSRQSLYQWLSGYDGYDELRRADRFVRHLEAQRLVSRTGRGLKAAYTITTEGRKRVAVFAPQKAWDHPWDELWRVFTFDLPEVQRKQRVLLWRALHAKKFGLLQRSVWVWPHDVAAILEEIVEANGIPECFCGFESRRLFLCTNEEVAATAWEWEEIHRRHRSYLQHNVVTPGDVRKAVDLAALARLARTERMAYQFAFSFDPLLPRRLWPPGYQGEKVHARHESFRCSLRQRQAELG